MVTPGSGGAPAAGPRIGAQLRAARLASRRSIAEVAVQSGLTKGFLSKLERDLTNVSVASLMRLCDTLGISVGSLFQAAKGEVVRKGEYTPINFGGSGVREYLLTPAGRQRPLPARLRRLADRGRRDPRDRLGLRRPDHRRRPARGAGACPGGGARPGFGRAPGDAGGPAPEGPEIRPLL